jgi:ElaB/YqjD/DUF883 family membrane-anchored ribosome-binding protein
MPMNANTSSGTYGSAVGANPADAERDVQASHGRDRLNEDVQRLRRDVASLTDTLTRVASQVGGEAAKAVRDAGQSFSAQVGSAAGAVGDATSDLASSAKEHAKTFASELEGMARRNPLGTIAGALLVGVVIGMMSRGRG